MNEPHKITFGCSDEQGLKDLLGSIPTTGVAGLAKRFSKEVLGKEPLQIKVDAKAFGYVAGPMRDLEIVENSDLLLAFVSRDSKRTKSTVKLARKRAVPVVE